MRRADKLVAFTCRFRRDSGASNSWKTRSVSRPLSKISLSRLEKPLQSRLVLGRKPVRVLNFPLFIQSNTGAIPGNIAHSSVTQPFAFFIILSSRLTTGIYEMELNKVRINQKSGLIFDYRCVCFNSHTCRKNVLKEGKRFIINLCHRTVATIKLRLYYIFWSKIITVISLSSLS